MINSLYSMVVKPLLLLTIVFGLSLLILNYQVFDRMAHPSLGSMREVAYDTKSEILDGERIGNIWIEKKHQSLQICNEENYCVSKETQSEVADFKSAFVRNSKFLVWEKILSYNPLNFLLICRKT